MVLSKIISGGIPDGSVILISGEAGTGKTILASSIAQEELERGKRVMFISFNETEDEFFGNMKKVGLDLEKPGFLYYDLFSVGRGIVENQLNYIYTEIYKVKPDLIVIDSLTSILTSFSRDHVRSFLNTSISRFVKMLNSKAILISERPFGREGFGHGIEEFVVDGVISLELVYEREHYRRVMRILKMRGRKIEKPSYEFEITDSGLIVFEIPELDASEFVSNEKLTTGIPRLDELTSGGFYRGSITVVVGNTGSGKTTFGLHFCHANAMLGRRAVFVTFEESRNAILRAMENYGMDYEPVKDRLMIYDFVPEAKSPISYFVEISRLISRYRPDVMVIDSLSSLQQHMNPTELAKMMRYLQIVSKENGTAVLATLNRWVDLSSLSSFPATNLSTLADNMIVLSTFIEGGELKRKLVILKQRASPHSVRVHEYSLGEGGVVIHD
ncbi:MAG: AAA family ATPase [Archaeoglobi archaeon]|nr:AAA family ATPase [Archaeoglobi archaeon]